MPDLEHYKGREQVFIKHALIENYLAPFTIKIGSAWKEIVFLDAFAGPWNAQSADFSDTSFAIGLRKLEGGLEVLKEKHRRSPGIRAVLIEKDPGAFSKLYAFVSGRESNGVDAQCLNGAFEELVPGLRRSIKDQSFLFALIDPKGWTGLSMAVIAPLLRKTRSEVLVNVMTSFIRRFVDVDQCENSYKDFFGRPGVREIIKDAPPEERQDTVVREYCRSLRHQLCGYNYVSSCVVLEPDKKGVKYFMVFATDNPMGIKVFKEAEARAASLQDEVKFKKEFGNQRPLFSADQMEPVSEELRKKYRLLAFERVNALFRKTSDAPYYEVFCKALAMPLVTEAELIDFLREHPSLNLNLDGECRKKPDIQKEKDRVVKVSS